MVTALSWVVAKKVRIPFSLFYFFKAMGLLEHNQGQVNKICVSNPESYSPRVGELLRGELHIFIPETYTLWLSFTRCFLEVYLSS